MPPDAQLHDDWLSVYSRHYCTYLEEHDTESAARNYLESGEDSGELFGLAIYQRSTGLVIPYGMRPQSVEELRPVIGELLAES